MNDFKEIRNNLINMLEDLDERLADVTNDVNQLDETAIKTFEDEVFDSSENTNIQKIEKIKQAISRIDSETYGICLICGATIKKDRLNNNPFSRLCLHCKEKKDDS